MNNIFNVLLFGWCSAELYTGNHLFTEIPLSDWAVYFNWGAIGFCVVDFVKSY